MTTRRCELVGGVAAGVGCRPVVDRLPELVGHLRLAEAEAPVDATRGVVAQTRGEGARRHRDHVEGHRAEGDLLLHHRGETRSIAAVRGGDGDRRGADGYAGDDTVLAHRSHIRVLAAPAHVAIGRILRGDRCLKLRGVSDEERRALPVQAHAGHGDPDFHFDALLEVAVGGRHGDGRTADLMAGDDTILGDGSHVLIAARPGDLLVVGVRRAHLRRELDGLSERNCHALPIQTHPFHGNAQRTPGNPEPGHAVLEPRPRRGAGVNPHPPGLTCPASSPKASGLADQLRVPVEDPLGDVPAHVMEAQAVGPARCYRRSRSLRVLLEHRNVGGGLYRPVTVVVGARGAPGSRVGAAREISRVGLALVGNTPVTVGVDYVTGTELPLPIGGETKAVGGPSYVGIVLAVEDVPADAFGPVGASKRLFGAIRGIVHRLEGQVAGGIHVLGQGVEPDDRRPPAHPGHGMIVALLLGAVVPPTSNAWDLVEGSTVGAGALTGILGRPPVHQGPQVVGHRRVLEPHGLVNAHACPAASGGKLHSGNEGERHGGISRGNGVLDDDRDRRLHLLLPGAHGNGSGTRIDGGNGAVAGDARHLGVAAPPGNTLSGRPRRLRHGPEGHTPPHVELHRRGPNGEPLQHRFRRRRRFLRGGTGGQDHDGSHQHERL